MELGSFRLANHQGLQCYFLSTWAPAQSLGMLGSMEVPLSYFIRASASEATDEREL